MGKLLPDFAGEVAIVTGAGRGIGREVALALAGAGARVHGFDLEPPEPPPAGTAAPVFHEVDVRSTEQVEVAVAAVLAAEGKVDLLVNNAGITRDHALWKITDAEWAAVLDVNLAGAHRLLRAVAPSMRAARHGRVVQVASINGLRGKFGQANYGASKGGLIAFTRTAARELGPRGITVNAVAPGMIETDMFTSLPDDVRAQAVAETALGHVGRPADVAAAVLFLLSDAAAHVTGTVLVVDGGQTA